MSGVGRAISVSLDSYLSHRMAAGLSPHLAMGAPRASGAHGRRFEGPGDLLSLSKGPGTFFFSETFSLSHTPG